MSKQNEQDPQTEMRQNKKRIYGASYAVIIAMATIGILISINQLFQLRIAGFMPIASGYYYCLLATFLSISFLIFPARKADAQSLRWYDWLLFATCVTVNIYFAVHAHTILTSGWEYEAPILPLAMSFILWGLALEAVRRTSGAALFFICLVFSFYPIYGQYLKGILWGTPFTLTQTACFHAMGVESIIGIATRVVGNELIGYIIFGAAVVVSGGGKFFMDFAMSLFGNSRGGAAKVAIISSGFMASLSGSVVSNIVTTGTLTIPAMVKTGYSPRYAASVEACSSTGGTITPPIMGAAGFLIASFLNVPYSHVMLSAAIPALLFFFMLYLQADLHAAKLNLEGFDDSEIPNFFDTLKEGWFFIGAIGLMIVLLLVFRITAIAPFYTIIFLFFCTMFNKKNRIGFQKVKDFLYQSGVVVGQITAILAGIGLIIGAFSATGVANSFSRELVILAGDSVFLLLVLGAITSFVLGIGMTVTACYVFLAVVLVPALVKVGLDPMACHLFVLFCGNLSYITPPVALGSISAAAISGSSPMGTAFTSCRIGISLFILPFLFVVNPALILHGSASAIIVVLFEAIIASLFIAAAAEGWLFSMGHINLLQRGLLFTAGALILFPMWELTVTGLAISLITIITIKIFKNRPTLITEQ